MEMGGEIFKNLQLLMEYAYSLVPKSKHTQLAVSVIKSISTLPSKYRFASNKSLAQIRK